MDENKLRSRMDEVASIVSSDVLSIRTGKANPGMVSDISVLAYGGTQRLKVMELASITVLDSATIVIQPWDKSIIGDIKKGIEYANIGISPVVDNEVLRISIPPLTTEDRDRFVKLLSTKMENGRVMIRQIRGDAMKDIKDSFEQKEITEDEKFATEKRVQEITDEYIEKIESIGEKKRAELLSL